VSWIEIVAVLFGIGSVYLNARQNPWGWGASLVNVGLYTFIFLQGRLYALMGLQACFAVISAYGWIHWLRGGEGEAGVRVTRIPARLGATVAALALVGTLVLGWSLDRYTEDRQPYLDAGLSVVSLAAQWMMARKHMESWIIWVGVNTVAVPFFAARGEYPTAVQYAVFLGLAINGLRQWYRAAAVTVRG
jgi:nicotinamide mononucleotide transporter